MLQPAVPPRPSALGVQLLDAAVWRPGIAAVALVGASKNSGKTTALNALTAGLSVRGETAGLVSIGLDGEAHDAWLNLPKPAVRIEKGTLVATTRAFALASGLDIVRELGFSTSLGPTVLGRGRAPTAVQLAGIGHRAQLQVAVHGLRAQGAVRVLVDGAYHRQAAAHPAIADRTIAAVGAILGDNAQLAADEAEPTLWALTRRAAVPGDGGEHVAGALSDAAIERLPPATRLVVVRDPSRILASRAGRARLAALHIEVRVQAAVPLCAVTINPHRPGGVDEDIGRLGVAVRRSLDALGAAHVPIVDVVSGWHDGGDDRSGAR